MQEYYKNTLKIVATKKMILMLVDFMTYEQIKNLGLMT